MAGDASMGATYASRIETLVAELIALIEQTPEDRWAARPGADQWSAAEICGHIAEMMPYWAAQASELAESPGMSIGRELHDPRRVGGAALGADTGRRQALNDLRAAAEQTTRLLRALPDAAWGIEGRHITRGAFPLESIIADFIVGHLAAHIEQARAALASDAAQSPA